MCLLTAVWGTASGPEEELPSQSGLVGVVSHFRARAPRTPEAALSVLVQSLKSSFKLK